MEFLASTSLPVTVAAVGAGLVIAGLCYRRPDLDKFFRGKRIIITGASTGIGAALAVDLSQYKCKLVVAARSREALEEVAQHCRRNGSDCIVVPTDITEQADCKALVDRTVDAFGGLDILILNAGVSMSCLFENVTDLSIFGKMMKLNYEGNVFLTHFALPHLLQTPHGGYIVPVSSQAAIMCPPYRSGYVASKAAVDGFFTTLRLELEHTHPGQIRVVLLNPGFIDTNIRERAFGGDGQKPKTVYSSKGMMSVPVCVDIMKHAIALGTRQELFETRAAFGAKLKYLLPGFVDRLVRKTVFSKVLQD